MANYILIISTVNLYILNYNYIVYPIGSMYGIFTYIYHQNQPNVGKYSIHGWYGYMQRKSAGAPFSGL